MDRDITMWILVIPLLAMLPLTLCEELLPFEVMEGLLHPSVYNRKLRPQAREGRPTDVEIMMYVNDISTVNEINMDYRINIYFRQYWTDPRLAFNVTNKTIALNYNQFDDLWVPDTMVKNEKHGTFHTITVPNRMILVSPSGSITYSQRLSLTLSCQFYLHKFPLDNQTCSVFLESYAYTTEDIRLFWRGAGPFDWNEKMMLPEFEIKGSDVGDCTQHYATGSFSCIYARFMLERQYAYYISQTYIPTILIVILSWVSFWIDKEAVPARITLGLLTVLTMTTQSSSISQRLPRVSYIKGIDIWMSTAMFFVFSALVEYSIVNVYARNPPKAKPIASNGTRNNYSDTPHINDVHVETPPAPRPPCCGCLRAFINNRLTDNRAENIDIISRFIFPASFVLFNIAYWSANHILNVWA